jgi:hypothetical protein
VPTDGQTWKKGHADFEGVLFPSKRVIKPAKKSAPELPDFPFSLSKRRLN